ncbi:MAG: hypothetical protein ACLPIG_14310 [Methylocella sp.]
MNAPLPPPSAMLQQVDAEAARAARAAPVRAKLKQAILYIERNPKIVKSITSFPYIRKSF